MFLLATTALAGVLIGWPCQRLNWGWRNVWATCSIHSWAPAPATTVETPAQIPTGFRQYSSPSPTSPTNMMTAGGWYQPAAPNTAVPQYFCTSAAATGSGVTASLRNRCRRAVDAYGALVKQCTASPSVVPPVLRGPNTLSPDNMPAAGHAPHLSNVAGLSVNAQFCVLPAGTPYHPNNLNSPSNTCPGLLGWFTVVYNACGFTNAPSLNPTNGPNTPNVNGYFPLGNAAGVAPLLVPGPVQPSTRVGYFCTSSAVAAPDSWNQAGSTFRTSRCRKALDQFGRTAQRCHQSTAPQAAGPAQAGGYSDPLRLLALGSSAATATPNGLNIIAPACN